MRPNDDFFQSQLGDAAKTLYAGPGEVIKQAFAEGRILLITHDEVLIIEDWVSNHDPGDEVDGIQKACERAIRAMKASIPTSWEGIK
jgi:hypothetical protein